MHTWTLNSTWTHLQVKDGMLGMTGMVCHFVVAVYTCEDKSVFCKTEATCIQTQVYLMARQAMKQHTCGWKEVWGYILACRWNPWALFCNTQRKARRFILLLQEQIQQLYAAWMSECLKHIYTHLHTKHTLTDILLCPPLSYNTFYRGSFCISRLLHWRCWSV